MIEQTPTPKPNKKQSIHYIDNNKFDEEIRKHKTACQEADNTGIEKNSSEYPRISNYLGSCITKICKKIASRGNFSGYSYIDEMVSDAQYICIKYFNKFDPDRGYKAFSYFSKIAWQAFLGRIAYEKNQEVVKYEILKHEIHNSKLSTYQDIDLDMQEHQQIDIDSDYYKGIHAYKEQKYAKKEPKVKVVKTVDIELQMTSKLSGNTIADFL